MILPGSRLERREGGRFGTDAVRVPRAHRAERANPALKIFAIEADMEPISIPADLTPSGELEPEGQRTSEPAATSGRLVTHL